MADDDTGIGIHTSLWRSRRFTQAGLPEWFPGAKNPFPWMSEIMSVKLEVRRTTSSKRE